MFLGLQDTTRLPCFSSTQVGAVRGSYMDDVDRRLRAVQLFTAVTLFWLFGCYVSWVASGCRPYMPFISDFDLYEPGDTLFTVGLTLTSLLVVWVMIELQLHNREGLYGVGAHWGWHVVNHAAILPGMVGAYSALMLARTPWDVDGFMHGTYAFEIFYKGIYWCVLVNVVTVRIHWRSSSLRTIMLARATPCIAAIVGLWRMVVNQVTVWTEDFDWGAWNAAAEDMMAFCSTSSYPALDRAALWEFVLVLGIVFTVQSFVLDLRMRDVNEARAEDE